MQPMHELLLVLACIYSSRKTQPVPLMSACDCLQGRWSQSMASNAAMNRILNARSNVSMVSNYLRDRVRVASVCLAWAQLFEGLGASGQWKCTSCWEAGFVWAVMASNCLWDWLHVRSDGSLPYLVRIQLIVGLVARQQWWSHADNDSRMLAMMVFKPFSSGRVRVCNDGAPRYFLKRQGACLQQLCPVHPFSTWETGCTPARLVPVVVGRFCSVLVGSGALPGARLMTRESSIVMTCESCGSSVVMTCESCESSVVMTCESCESSIVMTCESYVAMLRI